MQSFNPEEDLMSLQIQLEESMTQRGAEKYLRDVSKAIQAGREEGTAYGQAILSHRLEALATAIEEWKVSMSEGVAGRFSSTYPLIKDVQPSCWPS